MTKNITSEESSRHIILIFSYKGIEEPRQITVTTYCSDNSGNPVKESRSYIHSLRSYMGGGK